MAKYSINMSREYKALEHLIKVREYFSSLTYADKNEDVLEMIKEIEQKILEKMVHAIRILGSAMLSDPNAEIRF